MTPAIPANRSRNVLLVDDDENDIYLLRAAFETACCNITLHVVNNGRDCLAFLRKEGQYEQVPTPDLVLLDLNMPIMDGREALAVILADPRLKALPIVVMTTSINEDDVRQMYELRCSTFVTKPLDFDALVGTVDLLCRYWFGLARLPGNHRHVHEQSLG